MSAKEPGAQGEGGGAHTSSHTIHACVGDVLCETCCDDKGTRCQTLCKFVLVCGNTRLVEEGSALTSRDR